LATKAIERPSGDQRGSASFSPAVVSRRGSPPKADISHRLDDPLFCSMS